MIIRINQEFNPKVRGMISLAMKAGAIAPGEGKAQDAIRGGKASMIIVSADASDNTAKKFSDMGAFRDLPVVFMADRDSLGRAIGRKFAVVLAVCDKGFADSISKNLEILNDK